MRIDQFESGATEIDQKAILANVCTALEGEWNFGSRFSFDFPAKQPTALYCAFLGQVLIVSMSFSGAVAQAIKLPLISAQSGARYKCHPSHLTLGNGIDFLQVLAQDDTINCLEMAGDQVFLTGTILLREVR